MSSRGKNQEKRGTKGNGRNKSVLDEYGSTKKGARAVSALDAKLAAMQNLLYGALKNKQIPS